LEDSIEIKLEKLQKYELLDFLLKTDNKLNSLDISASCSKEKENQYEKYENEHSNTKSSISKINKKITEFLFTSSPESNKYETVNNSMSTFRLNTIEEVS